MSAAATALADQLEHARGERRERLTSGAIQSTAAARMGGMKFLTGDRVFDVVSGRVGAVVAKTAALTLDSKAVAVQLEGGAIVVRQPSDLIWRPTPPGVQ